MGKATRILKNAIVKDLPEYVPALIFVAALSIYSVCA